MAGRKNKHGRVGVKERLVRPAQPVTLKEAEDRGYRKGYAQGSSDGVREATRLIAKTVIDRKMSASNIRAWLKAELERIGA